MKDSATKKVNRATTKTVKPASRTVLYVFSPPPPPTHPHTHLHTQNTISYVRKYTHRTHTGRQVDRQTDGHIHTDTHTHTPGDHAGGRDGACVADASENNDFREGRLLFPPGILPPPSPILTTFLCPPNLSCLVARQPTRHPHMNTRTHTHTHESAPNPFPNKDFPGIY